MTLYEFLDRVTPRIVGGDEYFWKSYGENARYLDLESNVSLIFDEKTNTLYEVSLYEDGMLWRHPAYQVAYMDELKSQRVPSDDTIASRSPTTEDINDIIEKINKLYAPIPKPESADETNPFMDIGMYGENSTK